MLSALQKSMNYCEIQYFIKYYYTHSSAIIVISDEFLLLFQIAYNQRVNIWDDLPFKNWKIV